VARVSDLLPVRRDEEHLEAHINASFTSGQRQRLGRHLRTRAADIPAIRFVGDGHGLGGTRQRTMQPHADAAKLGQAEDAPVEHGAIAVLGIGEGVVAVVALKAGRARRLPSGDSAEERLIRCVYAAQHILQDLRMDLGVFGARDFEVWQLHGLLIVGGAGALSTSPPGAALFQGTVVERATAQHDRCQRLFLLGRWQQLVLVGFTPGAYAPLLHADTFCLIGGRAESVWDMRRLTATRLSSP
jgi:hypothetical protein